VRLPTRISVLSIALLTAGCGQHSPSDASIIARFTAHRAEFSVLLEMFRHDGIEGRFGCDGPPDDAQRDPQRISAQRRAEYVKLFETIGCDPAVYYYSDSGKATFSLWSVGMLFAGQGKSIMFIPGEPPTPLVATTYHYRWTQKDYEQGYVPGIVLRFRPAATSSIFESCCSARTMRAPKFPPAPRTTTRTVDLMSYSGDRPRDFALTGTGTPPRDFPTRRRLPSKPLFRRMRAGLRSPR
jgi:hypothetical protein